VGTVEEPRREQRQEPNRDRDVRDPLVVLPQAIRERKPK